MFIYVIEFWFVFDVCYMFSIMLFYEYRVMKIFNEGFLEIFLYEDGVFVRFWC